MTDDLPPLGALVDTLRRQSVGAANDTCPTAEQLADVAAGLVNGTTRRTVIAHLERCHACAEDYRIALDLRSWSREAARALPVPHRRPRWMAWLWAPIRIPAGALAATVLVAGLWFTTTRLERSLPLPVDNPRPTTAAASIPAAGPDGAVESRPPIVTTPLLNVPIVDLEPRDAQRGEASSLATIPSAAPVVTLVLAIDDGQRTPSYDVEIRRADGTVSYRGSGLVRTPEGAASLTVPVTLFGRGVAVVSLLRPGASTVVQTYRLRVTDTN
jgi:hypothetical protein